MVNTGKPSGGCFACKKRRVKCGKEKPECKRCTNMGKACPGYLDEWASKYRGQNDWAEKTVQTRVELKSRERATKDSLTSHSPEDRKSSLSPKADEPSSPDVVMSRRRVAAKDYFAKASRRQQKESKSSSSSSPSSSSSSSVMIARSPFVGPEVFTINHFYNDYVAKRDAPFLDFLPDLYSKQQSLPCFEEIVPAVALASTANQMNRSDLMIEARKHYGKSIATLGSALKDPETRKSDGVLLTVFLLSLFELISADKTSYKGLSKPGKLSIPAADPHSTGGRILLQLRGLQQLNTHVGRNLFILLNLSTLVKTFITRAEPANELYRWTEFPQSWVDSFALSDPIYQAAKYCADVQGLIDGINAAGDTNITPTTTAAATPTTTASSSSSSTTTTTSTFPFSLPTSSRIPAHQIQSIADLGTQISNSLTLADSQLPNHWPSDLSSAEHTGAFGHLSLLWGNVTQAMARMQYRTMRLHIFSALCDLLKTLLLLQQHPPSSPSPSPSITITTTTSPEQEKQGREQEETQQQQEDRKRHALLTSLIQTHQRTTADLVDHICLDHYNVIGPLGPDDNPAPGVAMRAYTLLWPFRVALATDGVAAEKKAWIRERLRWIGAKTGIGYATLLAETEDVSLPV